MVESKVNKGTKFTFTLPKYSAKVLFQDNVTRALRDAIGKKVSLSLVVFDIKNFDDLARDFGNETLDVILHDMEQLVKQDLRRRSDFAVKDIKGVLVMLPEMGKLDALVVADRIQKVLEDYVVSRHSDKKIQLSCKTAGYPEDGGTQEELLSAVAVEL
ncbi:GGDEF domain-containing protein [Candidatus Omnitrophota bacterium]